MSLAQQPGSSRTPDEVTRLRRALAVTVVALIVVLGALASLLVSRRRTAPPSPLLAHGLRQPASRTTRARAPRLSGIHRRPHAILAARRSRPRVVMVERRVVPPPATPPARVTALLPSQPLEPPTQRVLGQRLSLKPRAASPAARTEKLPLVVLPPPDSDSGETPALNSPPEPLARRAARYPEAAAAAGVTGSVRLKVIVGRRGHVEDAIVVRSSGDDRLDRAAAAAVRRWRYRPALRDGRAVAAVDYQVIEFSPPDREPPD